MTDASPQNERENLEEELHQNMQAAYRAYCDASAEHTKIRALYENILDHPDSTSGLYRAAKNERLALNRYTRALKAFSGLVLRGERPVPPIGKPHDSGQE